MNRWTVIIPTVGRPDSLQALLGDLVEQGDQISEVLVAEAGAHSACAEICARWARRRAELPLRHLPVPTRPSGLPASRNYAVSRASSPLIAFLDDDTRLAPDYLKRLREPFDADDSIAGVGGYITNLVEWKPSERFRERPAISPQREFCFRDAKRQLPARWRLRARLGLAPLEIPGRWTGAGHPWPLSFWPPGEDWVDVDFVMGGSSAWRRRVFDRVSFPAELAGYGLYEDLVFSLQISSRERIVLHRGARLEHHHEPSARPSHRSYGYQVTRNGYSLWRQFRTSSSVATATRYWLVELVNLLARLRSDGGLSEAVGRVQGALAGLTRPVSFPNVPVTTEASPTGGELEAEGR